MVSHSVLHPEAHKSALELFQHCTLVGSCLRASPGLDEHEYFVNMSVLVE
jgi:hypothetical protein